MAMPAPIPATPAPTDGAGQGGQPDGLFGNHGDAVGRDLRADLDAGRGAAGDRRRREHIAVDLILRRVGDLPVDGLGGELAFGRQSLDGTGGGRRQVDPVAGQRVRQGRGQRDLVRRILVDDGVIGLAVLQTADEVRRTAARVVGDRLSGRDVVVAAEVDRVVRGVDGRRGIEARRRDGLDRDWIEFVKLWSTKSPMETPPLGLETSTDASALLITPSPLLSGLIGAVDGAADIVDDGPIPRCPRCRLRRRRSHGPRTTSRRAR